MTRLVCLFALVAACAASLDPADQDAETAAPALDAGKADAASFVGLYHLSSSTWRNNDVTDLQLRADGTYVRARCYHASCATWLPETDHYDVVRSHGRSYVRFWSVQLDSNLDSTPVIADVYEIRAVSYGIQLRKTYTTRWFTLVTTTDDSQCADSGGAWATGNCTCPGNQPNMYAQTIFISGAGGCIATPGADESNCDSSGGGWTDDDSTAIGSFCVCGLGRYDDDTGSCANI